jgi:hypothetical protein
VAILQLDEFIGVSFIAAYFIVSHCYCSQQYVCIIAPIF